MSELLQKGVVKAIDSKKYQQEYFDQTLMESATKHTWCNLRQQLSPPPSLSPVPCNVAETRHGLGGCRAQRGRERPSAPLSSSLAN